jgi:hypothetical protein
MRLINYKSYDGKFYKVVSKKGRPSEMTSYLKKTYGVETSLPIRKISYTKDAFSFYELIKVSNKTEASPVVRVGEGKPRCPFCWERKCIKDSVGLQPCFQLDKGDKDTRYSRFIAKCSSRAYYNNYFLVECYMDWKIISKMMRRKQCFFCKANKSVIVFDKTEPLKIDEIFGKNVPRGLSEKFHRLILFTYLKDKLGNDKSIDSQKAFSDLKRTYTETVSNLMQYEYRCRACNLKMDFNIGIKRVNRDLYGALKFLSGQN